jgi:hypothetical protein
MIAAEHIRIIAPVTLAAFIVGAAHRAPRVFLIRTENRVEFHRALVLLEAHTAVLYPTILAEVRGLGVNPVLSTLYTGMFVDYFFNSENG